MRAKCAYAGARTPSSPVRRREQLVTTLFAAGSCRTDHQGNRFDGSQARRAERASAKLMIESTHTVSRCPGSVHSPRSRVLCDMR